MKDKDDVSASTVLLWKAYDMLAKRSVAPHVVIFLDGDNAMSSLNELNALDPDPKDIHVFCVMAAANAGTVTFDAQRQPWVSVVPTNWQSKDAADHSLSIEATHFHFYSQQNPKFSQIPFILVSNDSFVLETTRHLVSLGRPTLGFNPSTSIAYFLSKFRLNGYLLNLRSDLAALLRPLAGSIDFDELESIIRAMPLGVDNFNIDKLMKGIRHAHDKTSPMLYSSEPLQLTETSIKLIKSFLSKQPLSAVSLAEFKKGIGEMNPAALGLDWLNILLDRRNLKAIGCDFQYDSDRGFILMILQNIPK
jgi:hypothetical protein